MFTGIVEETGEIVAIERREGVARLRLRGAVVVSDARHGDSIAISGVCLTVVEVSGDTFAVDVVDETLTRSSLARLHEGDAVNLERAAALGQRLGGHIVQGHVDGTGTMLSRDDAGYTRFRVQPSLTSYLVEKGSVTVDGVSLTVVSVAADEFAVALIPTTLADTTLGATRQGDVVNLEVDVLAKYLEKLARAHLGAGTGGRFMDNDGD